jgi:hypothetical protein
LPIFHPLPQSFGTLPTDGGIGQELVPSSFSLGLVRGAGEKGRFTLTVGGGFFIHTQYACFLRDDLAGKIFGVESSVGIQKEEFTKGG